MRTIKIAGVCGSLREGSYNARLLETCRELAPGGVELTVVRLNDVEPFNADVEKQGWPPGVAALRERIAPADAVLFATPEYNYSIPGVLKNAIDWLSRPERKTPIYGKPAAIIGASPSNIGTARAQAHLRDIVFYNAMPLLASVEIVLFRAQEKFDENGRLVDEKSRDKLKTLMAKFRDWIVLNAGD